MTDNASNSPFVIHPTRETFDTDVMQRSQLVPVVIDFWAEWCAPCRMLAPILEKLADEYDGKFILAKVNTEEVPEAAAAFGVQSIPAVFGLIDGSIADTFMGAIPEAQIREWLNRLLNSRDLAEAKALEEHHPEDSEAKYRQVLQQTAGTPEASIGLARVLMSQQKEKEAEEIIAKLESRGFLEPEAQKIRAALQLHQKGDVDIDAARQAAEANPDDLSAQFALAEALAGVEEHQAAMDICLDLIERDRKNMGETARTFMIEVLRALPEDDELVSEYRRKLAMLLY